MDTQSYVVMRIKEGKDATTQTVYTLEANVGDIHEACKVDKDMRNMVFVKGLKVELQSDFRKHGAERMESELERLGIEFTREDNVAVTKGETDTVRTFKKLSPEDQAKAMEALRDAGVIE